MRRTKTASARPAQPTHTVIPATGRRIPIAGIALALLTTAASTSWAAKQFEERNGVVSLEAENATENSGWKAVDFANASGKIAEDYAAKGAGHLTFEIHFRKTGKYIVWARHAKGTSSQGCASDACNDCYATLDGKPLKMLEGSACSGHAGEVVGLGTHLTSLGWQSRPKTECSADRSKKHVSFEITQPGVHRFRIGSRSKYYKLDKLVFSHVDNGTTAPSGQGPAETAMGTSMLLSTAPGAEVRHTLHRMPDHLLVSSGWLPPYEAVLVDHRGHKARQGVSSTGDGGSLRLPVEGLSRGVYQLRLVKGADTWSRPVFLE